MLYLAMAQRIGGVKADFNVVRADVGNGFGASKMRAVLADFMAEITAGEVLVLDSAMEQVHVAQKLGHKRAGRRVVNFIGAAHLFNLAVVHHHHTV